MKDEIMKNKNLLIGICGGVVIILFVVIVILFSSKTTVCTSKSDQSKNGYILETKYIIKSKGKNVVSINTQETITSKDKKKLDKFEKDFKEQYSYNSKNYGGYKYTVTNKNGKVTTNVTVNYNKFDMKKFIRNNEAMKKYTEKEKLTLEGAKKLYTSTGAKCK